MAMLNKQMVVGICIPIIATYSKLQREKLNDSWKLWRKHHSILELVFHVFGGWMSIPMIGWPGEKQENLHGNLTQNGADTADLQLELEWPLHSSMTMS